MTPPIFIALYLDEDVDVLLVRLLRARGYAATTTQEAGNLGASDDQQLAYAVAHEMALLTHNRADFRLAQDRFQRGEEHAGIIIAVRHPAHEIARRLLLILNAITADEMHNAVRYI